MSLYKNWEKYSPKSLSRLTLNEILSRGCPVDLVEHLIRLGADVNFCDGMASTPLLNAVLKCRDKAIVRVLLQAGADINVTESLLSDQSQQTLLCMAHQNRTSPDIIQMLIESGCNVGECVNHGTTLHCFTIAEMSADLSKLILKVTPGTQRNKLDRYRRSAICSALRCQKPEVIQSMMTAGCSLTACRRHESPWFCATDGPRKLTPGIIQLLLRARADLKVVNDYQESPLHCALKYCRYEADAIRLLLRSHPWDVKVRSLSGESVLHAAVTNFEHPDAGIIQMLIDFGAEVDALQDGGNTPLHLAIRCVCPMAVVEILLKSGSPINQKNGLQQSPLVIAAEVYPGTEILKLLLRAGARTSIDDSSESVCLLAKLKQFRSLRYVINECFETFFKYLLLEDTKFDTKRLVAVPAQYAENIARRCIRELQRMKKVNIGQNVMLYQLIARDSEVQTVSVYPLKPKQDVDVHKLLRMLKKHRFPLYFDVIASWIGTSALRKILQEVNIYAIRTARSYPYSERRITLGYDIMCKVAEDLLDEELLSLILASFSS